MLASILVEYDHTLLFDSREVVLTGRESSGSAHVRGTALTLGSDGMLVFGQVNRFEDQICTDWIETST
jgi:hypothetical protein